MTTAVRAEASARGAAIRRIATRDKRHRDVR